MTAPSTRDGAPGPEAPVPDTQAAAARQARGSVHEAIGKLIGDDAARDHGQAEQRAGAAGGAATKPPRR